MPSTHFHKLQNEEELLEQLKNGNTHAFSALFNHYGATVYEVAYRFLQSHLLAEETVQDVFLKIWLKRNDMPAIKDFNAYLFIVARNIIFDRIKKAAYEKTAQAELKNEPFCVDDTEHLIRHHQCQRLLKNAVEQLPPQQQQVYCLAKEEGLSHEKIAERLGLSRLTVKTHMAKALQAIRRYLNSQLNNFTLLTVLTAMSYLF